MKVLIFALIPVMFLWARPAERPVCERKFVVGLNDFAPFAYRENGKLQGLAHDLVAELKVRTHCVFQENEISRPTAVEDLKRGKLDVVAFVIKSAELDRSGTFIPFFKTTRELTVLKSNWSPERKISDYVKDEKVKFAHLIGTEIVVSTAEDKKLMASSRFVGVPVPESAFQLLTKGRVQAILFSSFMTDYYVKKLDLVDKVVRIPESNIVEVGIYTSKRRVTSDEDRKFSEAAEAMKKDGTLLKILTKYMGEKEARKRLSL